MRRSRALAAAFAFLTGATLGCSSDSTTALIGPPGDSTKVAPAPAPAAVSAIVVTSAAELIQALAPTNTGRLIRLRAGSYAVSQPLVVPDGATLEGEGVMQFDAAGLPTGFQGGTRTTLTMTANVPGNVLSLGAGSVIRRLAIDDLSGRAGNAVGIVSRNASDRVSADIDNVEILNQTGHAVGPDGPTGCAIAVLTLNPNSGNAPPPHERSSVSARVTRSLLRAPAAGIGCGLFAFNFAPLADISVTLADNVVGGGIIASGGVSRPDAVYDSETSIVSHRNLYRSDTSTPCTVRRTGWNLQGGSGIPLSQTVPATERNVLVVKSRDDRLEGFTTGILGAGGRQFFNAPTAGPARDNVLDLQLTGTTVASPECAGEPLVIDFRLAAALVSSAAIMPGDGNILRAVFRGVTASGMRANTYANVFALNGPQPAPREGSGNRLLFAGNSTAFAQTNRAIDPSPGASFFTGGSW